MRIFFLLGPLLSASVVLAEPEPAVRGADGVDVVINVKGLAAAPQRATAQERAQATQGAQAVMAQRCALCHGASGRSDGIMSATLQPRPRDFSDPAWQRATSDAQLKKAILEGGHAIGKSPIMPANPDLKAKPDVLDELVRLIRGFERRGVVRATLVGTDGKASPSAAAAPDASGKRALVRLPAQPGTFAVRGYFDANENGQRDAADVPFEQAGVVVKDTPVRLEVDLSSAPPRP